MVEIALLALVGAIIWLVITTDWDSSKLSSTGTITVEATESGGESESPYEPRPTAEHTYRLEYFESSRGSQGYVVVRNEDGQNLAWKRLPKSEGLHAVGVAGESFHMEDLQSDTFEPGRELSLVREPDNPHSEDDSATAIFDADGSRQAGYVPSGESGWIAKKLDAGENWRCLSMWEVVDGGQRKSLRVLLVGPEASVELPD